MRAGACARRVPATRHAAIAASCTNRVAPDSDDPFLPRRGRSACSKGSARRGRNHGRLDEAAAGARRARRFRGRVRLAAGLRPAAAGGRLQCQRRTESDNAEDDDARGSRSGSSTRRTVQSSGTPTEGQSSPRPGRRRRSARLHLSVRAAEGESVNTLIADPPPGAPVPPILPPQDGFLLLDKGKVPGVVRRRPASHAGCVLWP